MCGENSHVKDKKLRCILFDILQSIYLEQSAISKILSAEGEKISKVVNRNIPNIENFDQLIALQNSVAIVIEKLSQKQNIILEELKIIKEILSASSPECKKIFVDDDE